MKRRTPVPTRWKPDPGAVRERSQPAGVPRRILRTLLTMTLYAAFSWIVLSLAVAAANQLALPGLFITLLVVMLFCGFLLAALLAWRYDSIGSWDDAV